MSEWSYVAASFGLSWAVLVGYFVFLHGKERRAREAVALARRESEVGR